MKFNLKLSKKGIITMQDNKAEMKIEKIMKKQFITSTVKEIDEQREERIRFITKIGELSNEPECSPERALVDGHRAIIGNTFRIIREAGGFTLEDMAERCWERTDDFKKLEKVGFLNSLDDNFDEFDEIDHRKPFIARIYIAWLKNMIEYDYKKSDEISFRDILKFNDAVILDIDELLDLGRGIENFEYIESLEDIRASYEAINDILGQY